jgi:hypothetical protein
MRIFYDEDSNYVHVETLLDRTAGSAVQAYKNYLIIKDRENVERHA